jgi:PEP-CTERM motif
MSSFSRSQYAASLGAAIFFALAATTSVVNGQTILGGLTYSYSHDDNLDPTLPENQDRITPSVWITRGGIGGIYNAFAEDEFITRDPSVISPIFTEWATELNNSGDVSASNWESLTFDTWLNAYGGGLNLGHNIVGPNAVMRIVGENENGLDDIYLDIRFTSWSQGGGGGFAYLRAAFPSEGPTGDYNGNHVVDAADYTIWRDTFGQNADPHGSGADGIADGIIDEQDYAFWKLHFGETVPGGSGSLSASSVPEPASWLLLLGAALILSCARK